MFSLLFSSLSTHNFKIDGEDYTGLQGNLTFAPREQHKVIRVPIVNDVLLERKEEIFFIRLTVTSSAPGLLMGASTVTVTITDDDCKYACQRFSIVLMPAILINIL